MGKLILARAAATDFDEQQRVLGTLDLPVSIKGQAELAQLVEELRGLEIETVFCSTEKSAQASAEFLGEQLDAKVKVLDDLHNVDLGLWQGLQVDELRRKHRKTFKQWEENPCVVCPPAGEMVDQVVARVRRSLRKVLKRSQSGRVLLVVPDPLRIVIRCELTHAAVTTLSANGEAPAWEVIDIE